MTQETTDIGALRGWAKQVAVEVVHGWDDDMVVQMTRAAAEIERLRAEVAELEERVAGIADEIRVAEDRSDAG